MTLEEFRDGMLDTGLRILAQEMMNGADVNRLIPVVRAMKGKPYLGKGWDWRNSDQYRAIDSLCEEHGIDRRKIGYISSGSIDDPFIRSAYTIST